MPRFRHQGQIIRSDTEELTIAKEISTFGDYTKQMDKHVTATASSTTTVDMTDIGTASFFALFTAASITVTLNGANTGFTLTDSMVISDSSITSVSLVNASGVDVKTRLIMAG